MIQTESRVTVYQHPFHCRDIGCLNAALAAMRYCSPLLTLRAMPFLRRKLCLSIGLRLGAMCFKPRNSLVAAPTAPRLLSFLVRAVVTGIGQARHVEFDRVAAFVASGRKATKDETAQGQKQCGASRFSWVGTHAGWLLSRDCRAGQTSPDHDCFRLDRL
jgi:hypothetical protein